MNYIKTILVLTLFSIAGNFSNAQTTVQYTGTFYNTIATPFRCACQTQKYLVYQKTDGTYSTITLCFDTEPGDYYQIQDKETITVSGYLASRKCDNGSSYNVLNVTSSTMSPVQRMLQADKFIKEIGKQEYQDQLAKEKASTSKTTTNAKLLTVSGSYLQAWSTKDDWSLYSNCSKCGRIGEDRSTVYSFDRISTSPEGFNTSIQVWGTKEGNTFYVTKWTYK